jgi:hypothetical protein
MQAILIYVKVIFCDVRKIVCVRLQTTYELSS